MIKTRECIGCGILTDSPGAILCPRCRIIYPPPPCKIKIMLVDHIIDELTRIKKDLEATLHYEVIVAHDGFKAQDKLFYEKPKLIIMEAMVPHMNAYEFVGMLRAEPNEEISRIPMIVISENKKLAKFFHPWDIQGFMVKPVEIRKLFPLIKDILSEGFENRAA